MQRNLLKQRRSDEEAIKQFGLVLDFDEFARKGSMSREEAIIAKWYGIYYARQPGNYMARVVIPAGQLTSVQARALAQIAGKYARGRISFTTRQAAQLHYLKIGDLPGMLREVKAAGLSTFHGCGDVMRNVVACPWAAVCPHRRVDVLPYAKATAQRLSACRDLDNLPRKFKISFSGCGGDCGQPYINCVGVSATLRRHADGRQESGFRVLIGGGMGWKPFVAQPLYGFVPPEHVVEVCRAAALLFRDHGDRYVRLYSRLKFAVARLGIDHCRELVDAYLDEAGVDRSRFVVAPVDDVGPPVPDRPLCEPRPLGSDGLAMQQIKIPKGEMQAEHLTRIAELAEMYGDKHIYCSNRQNLELHGIQPARLSQLRAEITALGLETDDFFGLTDVVPCVGTTHCPLAVSTTHAMFDLLEGLLREPKYAPIRDKAIINITGCPNSCSPYSIADIGLRGLRIRELLGSSEGYRVTVGGTQQHFGECVGEFKQADCTRVVAAILDAFLRLGDGRESLAHNVARVGIEPYRQAAAALGIRYEKAVNPLELSVVTGRGEAACDFKAIARDVPCRTACPARTNVPEYIRHLAEGHPHESCLVNQEDNVLPGVLGRICTRPCEIRCRYQWTSIHGPVQICHLKRAAADGNSQPPEPLPAYFGPSGRRIAIVGGGPAGLAAGRELRRYGHEATIFERESYLGGQVRIGVPVFRLPRQVLEADIAAILQGGVEVKYGQAIDAAGISQLIEQFDAVLLAAGAHKPRTLSLAGLPAGVAYEGLRFMKRFNDDDPLPIGREVVVIGGGFTAVDCARSTRRLLLSGGNVSIMYRRGEAQMAATQEELHEMRQENVRIETLVTPTAARVERGHPARMNDGRLAAVTFCRNVLDGKTYGHKPAFTPVPQSDFEIPCDTLIVAIGQSQEFGIMPPDMRPVEGHRTTCASLFIAGDFCFGNADVITALADGKSAAAEIDTFVMGRQRRQTYLDVKPAEPTARLRDHDFAEPPAMPVLPLPERGIGDEVDLGFGPEATQTHAWRCYLCNHKFEIDQDKCIHCDWCIKVSPRNCILRLGRLVLDADGAPQQWTEVPADDADAATYIWIDSDQCIRCGNCIRVCPVDAISVRKIDCATENCPGGGG